MVENLIPTSIYSHTNIKTVLSPKNLRRGYLVIMNYVSLQNHSEYTFHAGVSSVKNLVIRAKELGMTSVALTDTDRMSGLIVFYKLCLEYGIKPILGVELTDPQNECENIVLLAKNLNGYRDLCEIVTHRHLNKDTFSITKEFCKSRPDLFLITYSTRLLNELVQTPNRHNLYAALVNQDHRTRHRSKEVEKLAGALSVPLVVTNNTYFLSADDWQLHKILVAIGLNTSLSSLNPDEVVPQNSYLISQKRMEALFPNHNDALRNSKRIASQCTITFEFGNWILPQNGTAGRRTLFPTICEKSLWKG